MGQTVSFKGVLQSGHDAEVPKRAIKLALGALRHVGRVMLDAHRRRAEREMARYLERSGGRLTDDVERRMVELMSRTNFRV